jgi:hypothetical protein
MAYKTGIVLGDSLWLLALSKIGARRVILVDSVKPFMSALLAWPLLNEPVRPLSWLGIFITVAAVIIVSLEREKAQLVEEVQQGGGSDLEQTNLPGAVNVGDTTNVPTSSSLPLQQLLTSAETGTMQAPEGIPSTDRHHG